jgi:hypothetical protein
VDTTPPAAPVITGPANGSKTNDATPVATGTGEPGSTVHVIVDGHEVGKVVVNPDGTWQLPMPPMTDGDHVITARSTDPSGNQSTPSAPVDVIVDTEILPPTIDDSTGTSMTGDNPYISGTGEPGATVKVTVDGKDMGTAVVGDDGKWRLPLTEPISGTGTHEVTAQQTDPAGNASGIVTVEFGPKTPTPDTTAPDAPVILVPADGGTVSDPSPVIAGTGEPGATVDVSIDDKPAGSTIVDDGGGWTVTPQEPMTPGPHEVAATQTDSSDNTSQPDSNEFTLDEDGDGGGLDGMHSPVLILTPTDGSTSAMGVPAITGTGEPGDTIVISVDGKRIGSTVVKPDGSWSFTPPVALTNGSHKVTATQIDPSGDEVNTDTVNFTVNVSTGDSTPPAAPVITSPAPGSTSSTTTPAITGTGESSAIVIVIIDNVPVGSTVVKPDCRWSYTPETPLANGPHTVKVVQVDPWGHQSPPSQVSFVVQPKSSGLTGDGAGKGSQTTTGQTTSSSSNSVRVSTGGSTSDGVPTGVVSLVFFALAGSAIVYGRTRQSVTK